MSIDRVVSLIHQGRLDEAVRVCLGDYAVTPTAPELHEFPEDSPVMMKMLYHHNQGHIRAMFWIAAAAVKANDWSQVAKIGELILEMSGLSEDDRILATTLILTNTNADMAIAIAGPSNKDIPIKSIRQQLQTEWLPKAESDMWAMESIIAKKPSPSVTPLETPPLKKKNIFAVISLVLGVLGLCLGAPAIPAWILGHIAKKQISKNPNQEGMLFARIGKFLGTVGIGLFGIFAVCNVASAVLVPSLSPFKIVSCRLIYDAGDDLFERGQWRESLPKYEAALTCYREIADREGEALALNQIGSVYLELSDYQAALAYFEQALPITREVGNRDSEGSALNNIGTIYVELGNYTEALVYFEQASLIVSDVDPQMSKAINLGNTGSVHTGMGNYAEALYYYEQALALCREVSYQDGEATILNNIGVVVEFQGEYGKALVYYEQALAINREIGDREGEATNLTNIGKLYALLGNTEEALVYDEQALAIVRETGARGLEGIVLNNIGMHYHNLEDYAKAIAHFEQALVIHREIGVRVGESDSLMGIGATYLGMGDYVKALEYLEQALTIHRETTDQTAVADNLAAMGVVYYELEDYVVAMAYYEEALTISRELGAQSDEGKILRGIGNTYRKLGDDATALAYYEEAMDVFEALRATVSSDAGRAGFIAQHASLYDNAVNLYHIQSQNDRAFLTTERGRARAFLDALALGHAQLSGAADDLFSNEMRTYATRQAAQQALSQARVQWPDNATLLADLEAQLARAKADYEVALDAITARGGQLASLVPGRGAVLDLPQVQALLDSQTTLLAYWVLEEEDQVLAFIITRDALHTVAVDAPYDDLVAAMNDFRYFASLAVAHPESLTQLYDWLIAPLREYLTTPHLMIVPHDVLHYLPFAALTDGERFLVQDYEITYLPSVSVLPFIQQNTERTGGALLILGNPTTGDYDAMASFATERDGLGALPFAEQEARTIAALYGAPAYIGPEATEGLVRRMAGESSILHLAAHGKYNPVAPLSSFLALAPDAEHDGWLTVGEIYGLDLRQTDLVVLSACETQLGDLSRGDELVGMTRAFIYAGAPSVIASLWSVDDAATAQLMERFYIHLRARMGKAEALRQAQLDIQAEYPHPYYWAGFVLSGDGGTP